MSEKEMSIIVRLSEVVSELDKEEQGYILGIAEGMAIAKENQQDEPAGCGYIESKEKQ